jgi:hypothetical protein
MSPSVPEGVQNSDSLDFGQIVECDRRRQGQPFGFGSVASASAVVRKR